MIIIVVLYTNDLQLIVLAGWMVYRCYGAPPKWEREILDLAQQKLSFFPASQPASQPAQVW